MSKSREYIEITGNKKTDLENLKKCISTSDCIIIGEAHDDEYCRWFIERAILLFQPKFF